MLHVHDLVDFVSEEAEIAGRGAAAYIKGENSGDKTDITVKADGKIRYTVPQRISAKKDVNVYFRVSDVFRDKKVTVRSGDSVIYQKKHQKLAPGEMECVKISADKLEGVGELTFGLED